MIDYAQMLQMQGGNAGAARIGDLALNGGRTDVGAHLLGAVPRAPQQSQIPRPTNYGENFDINALLANAQSRVQPVAPLPLPVQQPVIPFQQAVPAVPAPAPVVQSTPTSLQGTIAQSNQTFGQTLGLPVPPAAPTTSYATPAAQMAAQPSYADIMFGTTPSNNSGYYDPLKQSWNQGPHVRPSAFYDPLKGY